MATSLQSGCLHRRGNSPGTPPEPPQSPPGQNQQANTKGGGGHELRYAQLKGGVPVLVSAKEFEAETGEGVERQVHRQGQAGLVVQSAPHQRDDPEEQQSVERQVELDRVKTQGQRG